MSACVPSGCGSFLADIAFSRTNQNTLIISQTPTFSQLVLSQNSSLCLRGCHTYQAAKFQTSISISRRTSFGILGWYKNCDLI